MPACPDLLTIGDNTVIHKDSWFLCYRAHAGIIEMGPVTLGRNVLVSERTTLDIGTSMGDDTQLGHASSLQTGQAVPEERYGTVPLPRGPTPITCASRPPRAAPAGESSISLLQLFNRLVLVVPAGVLGLAALLPAYLAPDTCSWAPTRSSSM